MGQLRYTIGNTVTYAELDPGDCFVYESRMMFTVFIKANESTALGVNTDKVAHPLAGAWVQLVRFGQGSHATV